MQFQQLSAKDDEENDAQLAVLLRQLDTDQLDISKLSVRPWEDVQKRKRERDRAVKRMKEESVSPVIRMFILYTY